MTSTLFPELTRTAATGADAGAPDPAPTTTPRPGARTRGSSGARDCSPPPGGRARRGSATPRALTRCASDGSGGPGSGYAGSGGAGSGRWCDWYAAPYRGGDTPPAHARTGGIEPWAGGVAPWPQGAREDFVNALRRDLRERVRRGEHIAFGNAADPYPPQESDERITRRALSALLDTDGLRISITTRSALVARDARLLSRLAERHAVHVNIVLATPDARLARILEPRVPAPQERNAALRALREQGVQAGVFLAPLLPGVSDADQDLDTLLGAAAAAGSRWVGARVVVLREPTRSEFLRALRRSYPRVAARYAWWTSSRNSARTGRSRGGRGNARHGHLPPDICNESLGRVRSLAATHGLATAADLRLPVPPAPPRRQATFSFAGDAW